MSEHDEGNACGYSRTKQDISTMLLPFDIHHTTFKLELVVENCRKKSKEE
ncbi:MAG: hypothetical protein P8O79_11335 [Halieaceae bacterium]|nr:hypothetical protein [Halieaceae bacterium]